MFRELLKKIAVVLDDLKIPYMVIGGQAVLLYGEPRLTKDIDITLGMGIDGIEKVKRAAQDLNFRILVDNPEDFTRETMVLPVIDDETGIRVDFIFSFSMYEKQSLKRSVDIEFDNIKVKFATCEDLIIHKIIAGRPRDIEDVKVILLKNPNCEIRYIESWLKKFDKSLNGSFLEIFRKIVNENSER